MALRLGVLASGVGLTLKHLLQASEIGELDATICVLISNKADSGAMALAKAHDVPAIHVSSRTHPVVDDEQRQIASVLRAHDVDYVLLAGWVKLVGPPLLREYPERILNLHPAVSPAFGGTGMYGDNVHKAVLNAGVKITGSRIHIVGPEYDTGPTLSQVEVPVLPDDDVGSLSLRVKEAERILLVDTLNRIAKGDLLSNGSSLAN
jgi:phosphoribosylglycinamide formyltransferase-1